MTKCLATLTAVAMGMALIPQAARAAEVPISGSFSVFYAADTNPGTHGCHASDYFVEAHGIGDTAQLGSLFLDVAKCYMPAAGLYGGYAGSFTPRVPNSKDTVTGTYTGSNDPYTGYFPNVFGPFHGTLTINGGTGRFEGAKGSVSFTAISGGNVAYYFLDGNVSFGGH